MKIAIIIALMLFTVVSLVLGIVAMIKGGEFNEKYGNRLMRFRVFGQAAAVIMLVILFSTGE